MFNLAKMTDGIKGEWMNSFSILVTKAKNPEYYYENIKQILQDMENSQHPFENKELIMEILIQMKDKKRVQFFMAARNKQTPEQCTFIEKFNARGWSFLNLDENEAKIGEPIMTLSYSKEFQKLSEQQKEAFRNQLYNKIGWFQEYPRKIKSLIQNVVRNWQRFLDVWNDDKTINLSNFKLNEVFKEVERFIINNDVYGSNELVIVEPKENYEYPSLIKSIQSINALEEIVQTVYYIQDFEEVETKVVDPETGEEKTEQTVVYLTFKDTMDKFKGYFAEMIETIKVFACSQEEEMLLERTKFILQRGFRQFQMLHEIDSSAIAIMRSNLNKCLQAFQQDSSFTFREKFIQKLDHSLIKHFFPSLDAFRQYQIFFKKYASEKKQNIAQLQQQQAERNQIFLNEHQLSFQIIKIDIFLSELDQKDALQCLLNALDIIIFSRGCFEGSPEYSEAEKTLKINKLSMKKLKIVKKIIKVLQSMSKVLQSMSKDLLSMSKVAGKSYLDYAFQLAKQQLLLEDTCQLYEHQIDRVSKIQKLKLYEQYADYCANWGKSEQAYSLLAKKMSLQQELQIDNSITLTRMEELIRNKAYYKQKSISNLKEISKLRIKIEDPQFNKIIQKIRYDLHYYQFLIDQQLM